MLKIDRLSHGTGVRLIVSGRIEQEGLVQLRSIVDAEAVAPGEITIDIAELRLLDRESVRFLVRCAARGIRLVNVPAFVREWMVREQHGVADSNAR